VHAAGGSSPPQEAPSAGVGPVPPDTPAPGAADDDDGHSHTSGLFGRDLLYVAVLSLQLVSATVVSPILAHVLPAAEFGHLASAIALHQMLVVLAVLGLDHALILLRTGPDGDRTARSIVAMGLVFATLLTGVAFVTEPLWGPALGFPELDPIVAIVIGWTPLASGVLMVSSLLLSQDRLRPFALVNVLASVGGQAVGLGVLLIGGYETAGAYAVGNLVTLAVTLPIGLLLVRPRFRGVVAAGLPRRALGLGLPLMVSNIAVFVLNASDRLVVLKILGPEEAGRYQIAYVVGNLAVLLLTMTVGAWLPRIVAVRHAPSRWRSISLARSGLLALMAPVILGVTLGAPVVLRIVAPPEYRPTDLLAVVFLVALAGFPVLLAIAWSWELKARLRTRGLAVCAVIAAVGNVALNIALVPHWGLEGAAAATVAAFAVEAAAIRVLLPREVAIPLPPLRLQLAAAAAIAASTASLWLPHSPTWDLARFALAVACLPWLLLAWRGAKRAMESGVAAAADGAPAVPA
jgi:O-antigen/teichoic acid export membrane protein